LAAINGQESNKKALRAIYCFKIIDWRANH